MAEPTAPTAPTAHQRRKTWVTDKLDNYFRITERKTSFVGEIRAGCVLFMTSAYILFLNPLILSGASSGTNTGMPSSNIVAATAISTGCATALMGLVANYPWVTSVQLGTNTYFVLNVIKPFKPCGYHSYFTQADPVCAGLPCTCSTSANGTQIVNEATNPLDPCYKTTNSCLGTEISFEQALSATFLEGLVFLLICFTGLRAVFIRWAPRTVLMAGACGIGLFIAFVGVKDMGLIVSAPYPTLLKLASRLPYDQTGWGVGADYPGGGFNDCTLYLVAPPYEAHCIWLSIGGLVFTGILSLWNVNGAFILGILFTMFISWIKFPHKIGHGGLIPPKAVDTPVLSTTAGALSFNWGSNTGTLLGGFFTFLYLDFIGSCITFVSMGTMCGIVDEEGNIPNSNKAFISDGFGSTMGGLLGSSALTTYVESASAVREGGRTGLTACVCALLFFSSLFLWPIFSNIPDIATGPILVIIGILIFMESVMEINWLDLSEAAPAFITMIGMPFTSNIAYGCIAGFITFLICKFVTYQLHPWQQKWPGYAKFKEWTKPRSMQIIIPGYTDKIPPTFRDRMYAGGPAGVAQAHMDGEEDYKMEDKSSEDDTAHGPVV